MRVKMTKYLVMSAADFGLSSVYNNIDEMTMHFFFFQTSHISNHTYTGAAANLPNS